MDPRQEDAYQQAREYVLLRYPKVKEWSKEVARRIASIHRRLPFGAVLGAFGLFLVAMNVCNERTSAVPSINGSLRSSPSADGWHTIDVFYGDKDLLAIDENQRWFSQVKQDEIVATLFESKIGGYFVDLAANHAVTLSNTLGLERQLQWQGGCHLVGD